ncbi:uncharacterized protein LOC143031337 [Oratosquilla oratoria]|uniref:uncharacterized protein LOC143031337 n=1 Tax=Oratosquilla oratoria TaxID=337810 RepID=UPI003F77448C
MATLCSGCQNSYFNTINVHLHDDAAATAFLKQHGVLPNDVQCPNCDLPCHYRASTHSWYCARREKIAKTKRWKQCSFTRSDYKGTFLEGTHLKPSQVISFVNHWLQKEWNHKTVIKNLKFAPTTSVDWRSFCSEVTERWLENQEPIGGEGIEVEIDETLFIKRKYNRGRLAKQLWVFGGIERLTKKCFLVPLLNKDRSARTLVPIIKKIIKPGTVVYSDSWRAYNQLCDHGYSHFVINHKKHFVDPNNPKVHTQNIEQLWLDLKQWSKRPGLRQQYLARYIFLHNYEEEVLHNFFIEAARVYPPQSNTKTLSGVPATSSTSSPEQSTFSTEASTSSA